MDETQPNRELSRRVNELQALLDILPVCIAVAHDPEAEHVTTTPTCAKILNVPANVTRSKTGPTDNWPFQVLQNSQGLPAEELPMRYAAAHEVALRDMELDILRADGALLNLLEYASPLYDEHAQVRGSLSVLIDITHRKRAEQRLVMLYEIARVLAESSSVHAAATKVLQAICETLGWHFGALWRVDPEPSTLTNEGVWHASPALSDFAEATHLSVLDVGPASLLGRVRQSGQAVWLPDLIDDFQASHTVEADKVGLHSALAFPILSGNRVIAIVECASDRIPEPDPDLMQTLHAIGNQIGIFLERKRMEEALAVRAGQQQLLAQLGIELSAALPYETRLANVARLLVPDLADWCVIDIVQHDQSVRPLAAAHVDPDKIKMLYALHHPHSLDPSRQDGLDEVLRSGKSELYQNTPGALVDPTILGAEQPDIARQLEPRSGMIVPLNARGRTLGAITMVTAASRRRYGPGDLSLAEEFARRVALAIDNAQLYAEAQELNSELERRVKERTDQLETAISHLVDEIAERRRAEEQVRILNAELEQRVAERTVELERVNADLQRESEEHQQARREAERANALKLKFLAMISHELRTPLTSIKGFATTLLAEDVEWDAAVQRDFLNTIDEEADKLGDLIGHLLDLSRMEAGTLRMAPKEQPFAEIISTAMAELQTIAADRRLVLQVPPDLPPIRVDGQRIAQVLINLVGNAAKYSPAQTTITISARQSGTAVQVDIADQGPGIPPKDRVRVFEAFRQLENEPTDGAQGTGLGLAICKGIVEAHGGRIWVQDRSGPGTVISFTLPLSSVPTESGPSATRRRDEGELARLKK